jgi:hypothetical protein
MGDRRVVRVVADPGGGEPPVGFREHHTRPVRPCGDGSIDRHTFAERDPLEIAKALGPHRSGLDGLDGPATHGRPSGCLGCHGRSRSTLDEDFGFEKCCRQPPPIFEGLKLDAHRPLRPRVRHLSARRVSGRVVRAIHLANHTRSHPPRRLAGARRHCRVHGSRVSGLWEPRSRKQRSSVVGPSHALSRRCRQSLKRFRTVFHVVSRRDRPVAVRALYRTPR